MPGEFRKIKEQSVGAAPPNTAPFFLVRRVEEVNKVWSEFDKTFSDDEPEDDDEPIIRKPKTKK